MSFLGGLFSSALKFLKPVGSFLSANIIKPLGSMLGSQAVDTVSNFAKEKISSWSNSGRGGGGGGEDEGQNRTGVHTGDPMGMHRQNYNSARYLPPANYGRVMNPYHTVNLPTGYNYSGDGYSHSSHQKNIYPEYAEYQARPFERQIPYEPADFSYPEPVRAPMEEEYDGGGGEYDNYEYDY